MKDNYRLLCIVGFALLCTTGFAQYEYLVETSVGVIQDGEIISMPWAGGINSVQINMMDFTGDGKPDLVLFERTFNTLKPLEWTNDG